MFQLPDDSVLRHDNYRRFWIARQLISGARQMVTVTIAWQIYDLARQDPSAGGLGWSEPRAAFLIGLIGLAQFFPILILSLFGGQAADRLDRRKILVICQSIRMAVILALVLTVLMPRDGVLFTLFGAAITFGMVNAFVPAAANALYPTLVPRKLLPKAVVWNSIGSQLATILGPAVAGFLLVSGESYVYSISLLMSAVATFFIWRIEAPAPEPRIHPSPFKMVREGLGYILHNKVVLGAITLDFMVVFFAGSIALLPVFARDILHVGEEGFGFLRAAPAVGAAAIAIMMSIRPIERRIGLWMFGSVFIFGVSVLVFGLSRSFWLSMGALVVYGAVDMISMYIRQSLVQLSTPDELKGRVSSVSFIFVSGSNELGEFESGVAAGLLGPVGAVLFGGGVAVAASGIWAWRFPSLARADRFEAIEEQRLPEASGQAP
ncbi:MFS transporter [Parvularcula sp. LCG005]|uniref:MFS transporter n=1 Tax=Parvularcula sp. LCG005 TaxID=3078805 RepID=UPI00294353A5|nr:MFS transporter [Parvularcula sp. LCG005]WOI52408.1 MFS transporter [Parvularcula sp. LCG005]